MYTLRLIDLLQLSHGIFRQYQWTSIIFNNYACYSTSFFSVANQDTISIFDANRDTHSKADLYACTDADFALRLGDQ
jgi:hypothetical protein